jgi:hypothetical protein
MPFVDGAGAVCILSVGGTAVVESSQVHLIPSDLNPIYPPKRKGEV